MGENFFEQFSPKNYLMAVFLEYPVFDLPEFRNLGYKLVLKNAICLVFAACAIPVYDQLAYGYWRMFDWSADCSFLLDASNCQVYSTRIKSIFSSYHMIMLSLIT